jgi:hypothetical protein
MSDSSATDWVTLAMAVFTAWMAWETRRLAKVATDSLRESRQPQLSLHAIDFLQATIAGPYPNAGLLGAQLTLQLKNPGHVRIVYDVEIADVVINGISGPPGPYDTHSGVIFPDEIHGFRLPPIPLGEPLPNGATGTLNFRVLFRANPNERASLAFTVGFVISSDVKWAYQSGPTYA